MKTIEERLTTQEEKTKALEGAGNSENIMFLNFAKTVEKQISTALNLPIHDNVSKFLESY